MTRSSALAAALLVASALVAAEPEFSADRIKAHVTFLADDLLEGREAGTRGHEIAARYVASQFSMLGLPPGGENGTYFQKVDLADAAQTGAKPTVTLTSKSGVHTLVTGTDAIVIGPLAGGTAAISGSLVFVGYGMEDKTLGFDDYAGLDVKGKVAVILRASPKGMDSEIGAHLRSGQLRVAAAHGAAGAIFVQTRATENAPPFAQLVGYASAPLTTWVRKDGTLFDPGGGLTAAIVHPKIGPILFEGSSKTFAQVLDEADQPNGRPKGFPLTTTARITATTTLRRFSSPEVIGIIPGADPRLKDEYVVLMAHADHIGMKATGTGDRINNGALDNAAGVATLLEVARAFVTGSERPRRSVMVVANTAEEKGLLGADYFAHYPTVPIEKIVAAVDLDMPMLLYDFTDVVAYGVSHSTLENAFRKAAAEMSVALSPDPMPEQAVFVRSDHYPMVKAGVPAVVLATGMANGGEAAWGKFLSGNYHQPSDDLNQPINWKAGAKFAELNYRVTRTLADADSAPQWYAKDYFGELFAPKAAKADKSR